MERAAYVLLTLFLLGWLGVVIFGLVEIRPFGLIGLVLLAAVGLLLAKALRDRMKNAEDDHYSRNVDL